MDGGMAIGNVVRLYALEVLFVYVSEYAETPVFTFQFSMSQDSFG